MKRIILFIKNLFEKDELVILKNKLNYCKEKGWNYLTFRKGYYRLHKECPSRDNLINEWYSSGYGDFDDVGFYFEIPKWENIRKLNLPDECILSFHYFDDSDLIGYEKEMKDYIRNYNKRFVKLVKLEKSYIF